MKLVYIAHPLGGDGSPEWGDRDKNLERALRFIAYATNEGHAVISWVHHCLTNKRGWTPHGDDQFYLVRDKRLMEAAEELWVCGPPELSSGTRFEIECAKEFGIPIIQKPEWMNLHFDPLAE